MKQKEIKALLEELREAKIMLDAYRPLGTPEEIRDALAVSFQLLECVKKIKSLVVAFV